MRGFPGGTNGKNPPANAGDTRDLGSILGSGRSPGGGNGNLLQYFCLENPMGRGAWWATVNSIWATELDATEETQHACMQTHGSFIPGFFKDSPEYSP